MDNALSMQGKIHLRCCFKLARYFFVVVQARDLFWLAGVAVDHDRTAPLECSIPALHVQHSP
jgi:hypothetical protein